MPYAVRLAREEDVPQLVDIEKEAFPTSWPATPFKRELSNRSASFLAAYRLSEDGQPSIPAPGKPLHEGSAVTSRGLGGVLKRLFRREAPSSFLTRPSDYVAGYVATWYMTDEAHITGIAVRESLRGNGLGELLLLTSIQLAMRRQSQGGDPGGASLQPSGPVPILQIRLRPGWVAQRVLYRQPRRRLHNDHRAHLLACVQRAVPYPGEELQRAGAATWLLALVDRRVSPLHGIH